MDSQRQNSQTDEERWQQARALYEKGRTARQIAHALGLSAAAISTRAADETWSAPPPPDWGVIRDAWEAGQSVRILASQYGVSVSALRNRRVRESWRRGHARGIDALRLAVRTLEETLGHTDLDDTVVITRLAAALSMAAGRLRDAEKQLLGQNKTGMGKDDGYNYEGENDAMREQMTEMLVRLAGEEEECVDHKTENTAPTQHS